LNGRRFNVTISKPFRREETSLQPESSGTGLPDAFGSYRVLHQIGAGALGPVFRAYDSERDRLVAVKLFQLDLPPDHSHRLVAQLEKLIDLRLTHPGAASALQTGVVGTSAYLAMEFVPADALDTVIREHGPASPADAVHVTTLIAGALDKAAAAGIFHGALHPRDVLVSPDDTRLTGLGVVQALKYAAFDAPVRRPYGSPERGALQSWDQRADIYSLAVLTYEMLSGRPLSATSNERPLAFVGVNGANREALEEVFARALAENPADRFETALAFVEAFKDALLPAVTPEAVPPPHEREGPIATARGHRTNAELGPRLPLDEPVAAPPTPPPPDKPAASASLQPEPEVDDPSMAFPSEAEAQTQALDLPMNSQSDAGVADLPIADRTREPLRRDASPHEDVETEGIDLDGSPQVVPVPTMTAERPEPDTLLPAARAFEPARSGVWPLVLALIIGVALGFAGGYGVGSHDRQASQIPRESIPARAPSPAASVTERAREFTEAPVQRSAKPSVPPSASSKPSQAEAGQEARSSHGVGSASKNGSNGRLLIRSTPAGARVKVDGRDVGVTPVTVRDLGRGPHKIQIARDGYMPADRRVTITSSAEAQSITIELARLNASTREPATPATTGRFRGTLNIDSRPTGASVYVDGKAAGTTPVSIGEVSAGDHRIRIERDGYRRWTASVRVVAGEVNRVTASLER